MLRKSILWLIWFSFIIYVLRFAPPVQSSVSFSILNPIVISLFSMIGILILVYGCLIFSDGRMQRLPAWAFLIGSAATGVLALIPYLALRTPNQEFIGTKDGLINLFDAKATGIILSLSTLVLLSFALLFGDWAAFWQLFLTNRFIHAMTIAFCLFCLLFPYPTLLKDDMARRGLTSDSQFFWFVALIPLFGALAYLCLRPALRPTFSASHQTS